MLCWTIMCSTERHCTMQRDVLHHYSLGRAVIYHAELARAWSLQYKFQIAVSSLTGTPLAAMSICAVISLSKTSGKTATTKYYNPSNSKPVIHLAPFYIKSSQLPPNPHHGLPLCLHVLTSLGIKLLHSVQSTYPSTPSLAFYSSWMLCVHTDLGSRV